MAVEKCESCLGSGRLKGLGNIPIKCNPCKGVGYISPIERKAEEKQDLPKKPLVKMKKRKIIKKPEVIVHAGRAET